MFTRSLGALVAVSLLFATNACGGGGGSPPSAPLQVPQAGTPQNSDALIVQIIVPKQTALGSLRLHLNYFSPATQSVVITAVGPSPAKTTTTAYVNVSGANPACTGYQLTTCNVALRLTKSGTYALTFKAYDHTQSSNAGPFVGRLLATNETQLSFVVGKTKTYSVSLDGIPAYFTISPNGNGYLQGSRTGLTLYGSSAQQVIVVSLDRDGNPIIGPGAPTIRLTPSDPSLTVTPIGTSNPNVFTLQAKTTGTPPVVAPGIVSLTAAASQPTSSGAGSATTTVPLRIAHSAVVVSAGSNLVELLDGNTSPSIKIAGAGGSVAMDRSGNVFVENGRVTEYPAGSASPTLSFAPVNGGSGIAVDPTDTIYLAYSVGIGFYMDIANVDVYPPGATSPSSTILAEGSGDFHGGLAVNAAGVWYFSAIQYYAGGPSAPPPDGWIYSPGPPYAIDTGTDNFPGALAVDAGGTLYAAVVPGTISEYASGTGTVKMTLSGLNAPSAIAVDAAGRVFVADTGKGGVVVYAAGATGPSAFLPLSGANGIAVLPSSAFSI